MAVETAICDLFSILNPEKTSTNVNILTQTLLNQIIASKTGKPASKCGSGDGTPSTTAASPSRSTTAASP